MFLQGSFWKHTLSFRVSVSGMVGREGRREQRVLLFSAGLWAACSVVWCDEYLACVTVQLRLGWEAESVERISPDKCLHLTPKWYDNPRNQLPWILGQYHLCFFHISTFSVKYWLEAFSRYLRHEQCCLPLDISAIACNHMGDNMYLIWGFVQDLNLSCRVHLNSSVVTSHCQQKEQFDLQTAVQKLL